MSENMFVKCGNKDCNNQIKNHYKSKEGLDFKIREGIGICIKCIEGE